MLINLRTLGQAPAAFFQRRAMRRSPLGQRQGLWFVRPAITQQSHKYRIAFMPQGSLGQRCETRQRCLSFKRSSPGSMPQGEPPWPLWQLTFHPGELQQVKKATRAVPIAGHMHVSDFLLPAEGMEKLWSLQNWPSKLWEQVLAKRFRVLLTGREKVFLLASLHWLLVQ